MNAEQRNEDQRRLEPLLVVIVPIGQHLRRGEHLNKEDVDDFHEKYRIQLQSGRTGKWCYVSYWQLIPGHSPGSKQSLVRG